MKVQSIQSINFESKKRFVTPETRDGIQELIVKMRDKTVYSSNGTWYTSTIFKEISDVKGRASFRDGKIYVGSQLPTKYIDEEALLTIDEIELVINNKTGEIISYHKPFLETWKKVMKKADEYIEFFKNNFNNKELVKQKKQSIAGFTKESMDKFEKSKEGVNG